MATKLTNLPPRIPRFDTRVAAVPEKIVDPHYATPAHRAWRAAVIERSGGRCQDPTCRSPGRRGIRLFADHIHEIKDGGALTDPNNGMARCGAGMPGRGVTAWRQAPQLPRPLHCTVRPAGT